MFGKKLRRLAVGGSALAALGIAAVPIASHAATTTTASGAGSTTAAAATVSYPVTFTVKNVDDVSIVKTVPGDGKTYQIQGHITAPAGGLDSASPAATLYEHGLGFGEWFWNFTAVPGHSYAQEVAQQGLTSVTIDKLGYGASGLPNGTQTGYGTDATIDHQIIQDLKTGNYQLQGHSPVDFSKVGLAGAGQGQFSAEIEDYTFHDASDLVFANFADEGFSPSLLAAYGVNVATCLADPLHEGGPGTPGGYQYRQTSPAQFTQADLNDTAPDVQAAAVKLQSKDPCGYPAFSVEPVLGGNNVLGATITSTPILSVIGADDKDLIVPEAVVYQRTEFALNHDATVDEIAGAGADITIGNKGPQFAQTVGAWLIKHGYGTAS